jgi:hypothetical protein
MTFFEKHIIDIFFERFINSYDLPGKNASISAERIYPEFENAPPNKKASFLEAAESLERRGVLKLLWYRRRKHEALNRIECVNRELLVSLVERPFPQKTIAKIKEMAHGACSRNEIPLYNEMLNFIAENVTPTDIYRGLDSHVFADFIELAKILHKAEYSPDYSRGIMDGITPRALSVRLYNDPKRIGAIRNLLSRLLNRAKKIGIHVPDFSFLVRAFPETLISGKLKIYFNDSKTPIVNDTGSIIGLPFTTIRKIKKISVIPGEKRRVAPSVLTVENKEPFYAIANSKNYSCFLYTGGYPSRAVNSLVRILSKDGFDFFHAGDVDPDGILILQDLYKNAEKPITPVCMDADTFNKYRKHGRKLEISMLNNIRLINDTIRSIHGIADLLSLIESTGLGIEQELIDYGCT